MSTWAEFEAAMPELAAFGRERMDGRVCYLATARPDGSPRVHPVTPRFKDDRIFVRMYPTSPKGHDLRRDGRYAIHTAVANDDGEGGEFWIRGIAVPVEDEAVVALVHRGLDGDPSSLVIFELRPDAAMATEYAPDMEPRRRRWRA